MCSDRVHSICYATATDEVHTFMNKNKIKKQFSYTTYNVYVLFYYDILWFYQNFKSENLFFLNQYSVHEARILDLSLEVMLSPLK